MNVKVRKQSFYLVICFLLSPLLALGGIFVEIYNKKKYAILIFSFFISICAYIYIPSGDLYRYYLLYTQYKDFSFFEMITDYHLDFIVYILIWGAAKLELGHAIVRFILVLLCSLMYFNIIQKISLQYIRNNKTFFCFFILSFFYFPFLSILTGLRFGAGLAFAFVSTYYSFVEYRKIKGFIFLLFSAFFHFSFIVLLPIWLLALNSKIIISRWTVIISCILILCFNTVLLSNFSIFDDFLIYNKMEAYSSGDDYIDTVSPLLRLILYLPRFLSVPVLFYILFKEEPSKMRNYLFYLMILVCLFSPFETPFGRYLSVLFLFSFLGYLSDYRIKECNYWKVLLLCSMFSFLLQIMPLYKSIKLTNYPSLLYTPYPIAFFKTYETEWINEHVGTTGEILN